MQGRTKVTQRELHYLEDCLKAEELTIRKCQFLATETTDPEVAEICKHMATIHLQHYNTLLLHLQNDQSQVHSCASMLKKNGKWRAGHIFLEAISCQQHLTKLYNQAAIEASSDTLRQDFFNILDEEHQLHRDIFQVMQRRGLYSPQMAENRELAMAGQHFPVQVR